MTIAPQVSAFLMVITAISVSGCGLNASPLHTKLSFEEFDKRVAKRFSYGMTYSVAYKACRSAWLEIPDPSPDPHAVKSPVPSLCVRIEPPGVYSTIGFVSLFNGRAIYGLLVLHFDSSGKLNEVKYYSPAVAYSTIFTPSHRVPLQESTP